MSWICGRFATVFLAAFIFVETGTVNSQPARNSRTKISNSKRIVATPMSTVTSPVLFSSTYLGGPGFEITWACAADKNGNVYIAGDSESLTPPRGGSKKT